MDVKLKTFRTGTFVELENQVYEREDEYKAINARVAELDKAITEGLIPRDLKYIKIAANKRDEARNNFKMAIEQHRLGRLTLTGELQSPFRRDDDGWCMD